MTLVGLRSHRDYQSVRQERHLEDREVTFADNKRREDHSQTPFHASNPKFSHIKMH